MTERFDLIQRNDRFPVDLHVHTVNSDGLEDPLGVIKEAASNGINTIAFAEHNLVADNHAELVETASAEGVEIPFPAIEVDTVYHNEDGHPEAKFHILGYGDGVLNDEFLKYASLPNSVYYHYFVELVDKLRREHGFDLPSVDDMMRGVQPNGTYAKPHCRQIFRKHVAWYIGQIVDMGLEEIKRTYLPEIPNELKAMRALDTIEVIRKLVELGCLAGAAHPGWHTPFDNDSGQIPTRLFDILSSMKAAGMCGLESMHRRTNFENQAALYRFAQAEDLMIVGGSDYHAKGEVEVGQHGLLESELDRIKEHLARVVAQ
ncbi:hypothetical protein HOG17_03195 [Candidatus Peregrinibacteria bacterium]|jgi:3',5'-nucleoside bisphosphate phosphatase|nr:hypothetical protein [Candidatus Peregrinibacteria bacterium]MBT4148213.1 hypothetical protein [Candidatus Peregrinibacteria bacterium]MBT4455977.1 hypothetical protein [Candidatus Peregrinibacteria bacterium]